MTPIARVNHNSTECAATTNPRPAQTQPHHTARQFPNDRADHRAVPWLRKLGSVRVVCETTGGYERAALDATELWVAVLNPRQGRLAKTDRIDAAVLADYGHCLQPTASAASARPSGTSPS